MTNHDLGDNFVRERTGSATMINLDSKWDHDFTNDQAAINGKLKKKVKIDKKKGKSKQKD